MPLKISGRLEGAYVRGIFQDGKSNPKDNVTDSGTRSSGASRIWRTFHQGQRQSFFVVDEYMYYVRTARPVEQIVSNTANQMAPKPEPDCNQRN